MATVVAGELFAAFVVFKNLRWLMLREAKISKQPAEPYTVLRSVGSSHEFGCTGAVCK